MNTRFETIWSEPRTLPRFAASGMQSHIVGPLTASRRPGALAVFHVGRCGSTVLTDMVGQHPAVRSDGETYVRLIVSQTEADPAAYVAHRLRRSGSNWFMYDLKFDHVTRLGSALDTYLDEIERAGVDHLVVLRRKNLLRKLVSGLMAAQRATYHSRDPEMVKQLVVTVDIDRCDMDGRVDSLVGHLTRWTALYDEFDRLTADRSVLRLEYEADLLEDPRVGYQKVADFLGLAPAPIDVRLQRLNPFALREIVANFDEVERALAETTYGWMLDSE